MSHITTHEFEFISQLVYRRAAIVLSKGKEYLVESRLAQLARDEGLDSASALVRELRSGRGYELEDKVIDAMTTNETIFFRDNHPFEVMRHHVLPELIEKRASSKQLHVWSAACSSGQEIYSFVMMLDEYFPMLRDWEITLLASDISKTVIAQAMSGVYKQHEVARGLPEHMLSTYFRREGADYVLTERVRERVQFREINLCRTWPSLPMMDVILLRNVLIYFDLETKREIFRQVKRTLRPDGYMFLGAAETTMNIDDHFERVQFDNAGCYQIGASVESSAASPRTSALR
ncbi:MAG: protein-glutamate O-methyltransferase CheR [Myxococcota bacterium]